MSTRGRQEIPEKQIVNPYTLDQRIRHDINRAVQTRYALDHVMSLKTVGLGEKQEPKGLSAEQLFVLAVRKYLTSKRDAC